MKKDASGRQLDWSKLLNIVTGPFNFHRFHRFRTNSFSYQNGTAVNVFGPYDPNAKMQMVYDTDSLDSSYIDDAPLVVAPPRRPPPPIPKQLDGVGSINKLHNSVSRKQLLSDIRKIGNLTKPSVILKKLNRNHQ